MLPRQLKEVAFGAGLNTKGDARAQPEQLLDVGVNVEFDDVGDLRCRFPFDVVRSNILGGGTIANARKLTMNGGELVCFTDVGLYSWSPTSSAWVFRGAHLAITTAETDVFSLEQDQSGCDMAVMSGYTLTTWFGEANSLGVYIGVRGASGKTILAPTLVDANGLEAKVVALTSKVLLIWRTVADDFRVLSLDPANVAGGLGVGTVIESTTTGYFDIVKIPTADTAALVIGKGASYVAKTITAGLAVATSTKARTADGAIAIAVDPTGTVIQIIRGSGTNVQGDKLTLSTLADALTNQAVGTIASGTVAAIAAAHRSVQNGGAYRCYAFWSPSTQTTLGTTDWTSKSNWVDTAGALGAQANFVRVMGIASRAFDHGGNVFFWGCFAGATISATPSTGAWKQSLQNAFFLYRDDALLVAKCCRDRGGGFNIGVLPGVQLTTGSTGFSWAATVRRRVPVTTVTGNYGYSARQPCEVTFTFDDNRARRTATLGKTMYIAGSLPLQYDGVALYELGFMQYPWALNSAQTAAGGSVAVGTYAWKRTLKFTNAQGEVERSTTAGVVVGNITAGFDSVTITDAPLYITRKTVASAPIVAQYWRTKVNPIASSPFFLISNQDPGSTSNPNPYVANDVTTFPSATFSDRLADASIESFEANQENGGVLSNTQAPSGTIIAATDARLFVADIAGQPDQVWYSKLRNAGEVAAFNEGLAFTVPSEGGAITAIGVLEGGLIVWRQTATYIFSGGGFDNTGGGSNYQLSRILSKNLGCVGQESCAYFDEGFLVKTNKGWFVLDRQLNYDYVGEGAFRYDAEAVSAMIVLTARHQVRILTSGRMLVYDTLVKQWAESSISDGLDLVLWNGAPAYLNATGVRAELTTWTGYTGTDASLTLMDVELGWIKFGQMQPRAIVDFVQLLGEYRSSCAIRVRLAKDYEATAVGVWNYHTDETWTPSPATVGNALQLRQSPRWKRCESLKVRLTVTAPNGVSPLGGDPLRLTSLAILFALEPNAYSGIAAAQKQ